MLRCVQIFQNKTSVDQWSTRKRFHPPFWCIKQQIHLSQRTCIACFAHQMGVDKSVCSMHAIYNCKLCEKSAMRVVEAVSAVRMCLGLLLIPRPVCSSLSLLISLSLSLYRSMSISRTIPFLHLC